jgi:hypothetical protein
VRVLYSTSSIHIALLLGNFAFPLQIMEIGSDQLVAHQKGRER